MTLRGLAVALAGILAAPAFAQQTGNVVFFHPDGTGVSHWHAARLFWAGADGTLNWDRLPNMANYRGHMLDRVVGTSNGGATTHAFGYKVEGLGSFGKDGEGESSRFIKGLSGFDGSILREAATRGHPIGVVNDGHIGEPGTGAFLAEVGNRNNWDEITLQIVNGRPGQNDPDVHVILGGGEEDYLPTGTQGVHGPGTRTDGRNLFAEAEARGYVVVRTRAEFEALRDRVNEDLNYAPKVIGAFARFHTFNDRPEERLIADGLQHIDQNPERYRRTGDLILWGTRPGQAGFNPPTIAEMMELSLTILDRVARQAQKPFMLVAEPESCDNFGNNNNAVGQLNALKRADDAIGVVQNFIDRNPNTLILVAADSDGSALQIVDSGSPVETINANPTGDNAQNLRNPLDGIRGRGTEPFLSSPDQFGRRFSFGVAWPSTNDFYGGILTRAQGLNANLLNEGPFVARFDNIDVYRLMHKTLFGSDLPYPTGKVAPDQ